MEQRHCRCGGIRKVRFGGLGFLGNERFIVANDVGFVLLSSTLQ